MSSSAADFFTPQADERRLRSPVDPAVCMMARASLLLSAASAGSGAAPAAASLNIKAEGTSSLTREAIESIAAENFAEDVEYDYEQVRLWSLSRVHAYFESGGVDAGSE